MLKKRKFIIYPVITGIIIFTCILKVFAIGNLAIYTMPAIAMDNNYNIWVYVGTGNKNDPQGDGGTERFYAIKDNDGTSTYSLSSLTNVTASTYTDSSSTHGWYINLTNTGEKVLNDATVFDQKVYFTTYTPAQTTDACCDLGGIARLYVVGYISAAGLLDGARSETVGSGVPSSPIISKNPYTGTYDVYVSTSVSANTDISHTGKAPDPSPSYTPVKSLLYWLDRRVN